MVIEDWEKCSCIGSSQQNGEYPAGRNFIFVSGILLAIFGAVALITAFFTIISFMINGSNVFDALSLLYGAVVAGVSLSFGIKGIQNADNPQYAQTFIYMGVALIALHAVDLLFGLLNSFRVSANTIKIFNIGLIVLTWVGRIFLVLLGFVISCILPILYIVGGYKLQGK
jgi:hypothetical protein